MSVTILYLSHVLRDLWYKIYKNIAFMAEEIELREMFCPGHAAS